MQPTIQYIRQELQILYTEAEIDSFIRLIFKHLRGYTLTDLVLRRDEKLTLQEEIVIREITKRLLNLEPIQYIQGHTEFAGMDILVNPSVLIPRPETEELMDWVRQSERAAGKALDMGTGSGCIALAVKKFNPETEVFGCDISSAALNTAEQNAKQNHLTVQFFKADILKWESFPWPGKFDLIISNPPYVTMSERKSMQHNVLDFEPHGALFVPNENPLMYYEAIIRFAKTWLHSAGSLYFEINEMFGMELSVLLKNHHFRRVELKKDLQGKARMIRAQMPD